MAIDVKVPEMGESIVDAIVGSWMKAEGDSVSVGETLLELETDKVNLEVTAESDGVLSAIKAQEGDTVTVGDLLATIEAGAAAESAPSSEPAKAEASANGAQDTAPSAPVAAKDAPAESAPKTDAPAAGRATPVVQRMAEEHGIDLGSVKGSGVDGRITRDDLMAHLAKSGASAAPATAQSGNASSDAPSSGESSAPKAAPAPAAAQTPKSPSADEESGRVERVRLSRRRQTIAKRLVEAQQTAAMLTTFNEVDMSAIMELRKRRKDAFKEQHGVNLGFMSFFTKAVVGALKTFPDVNSEMDGDALRVKKFYDIGIAVGAEEGLVVPVVRNADRMGFAQIEQEIVKLATKAREGKLAIEELQGGSFTITNGGVFGSLLSTPILNTPQVGILGMHTIQQRPIAVDGEVVIRPMMYIALSYDHRVVDGSTAVRFLVKIKQMLEDPETLLLEG